jgi:hypothetical protein
MISPFTGLQIDRHLICEFFGWFARFEYTLKETSFCKADQYGNAKPHWTRFQKSIGAALGGRDDQNVVSAIRYLVDTPPQVQKYEHGDAIFREVPLRGDNDGERAIEAARRVRNNLFHGGKHTPHSPPERDEKLIRCSLTLLEACLNLRQELRETFEEEIP